MKEKKKSDEASYNPCTDRKIMILSILKFDWIMIAGKNADNKIVQRKFSSGGSKLKSKRVGISANPLYLLTH
jgi:hypothetical protein